MEIDNPRELLYSSQHKKEAITLEGLIKITTISHIKFTIVRTWLFEKNGL